MLIVEGNTILIADSRGGCLNVGIGVSPPVAAVHTQRTLPVPSQGHRPSLTNLSWPPAARVFLIRRRTRLPVWCAPSETSHIRLGSLDSGLRSRLHSLDLEGRGGPPACARVDCHLGYSL